MMRKKELRKIMESIENTIESEKLAGINEIIVMEMETSGTTLSELEKEVSSCCKCSLEKTRTNTIFGDGSTKAELMFVGEAPGKNEDEQGLPFVGRAGKLLTKIIESIGLKREDVFIANILKCRPPENRNPNPKEIAVCSPFLHKQIELIKPKVICTLGKFASQTLLETEVPISQLRGKFYFYRGIKLMPTYHPAYLLRNSAGKQDVWEDMKMIAGELKLKIPKKN